MDHGLRSRLLLALRLHLLSCLGLYLTFFILTFLSRNLSFTFLLSYFLLFLSQPLVFLSWVLVCRPDAQPSAAAVRLSVTRAVAGVVPPRPPPRVIASAKRFNIRDAFLRLRGFLASFSNKLLFSSLYAFSGVLGALATFWTDASNNQWAKTTFGDSAKSAWGLFFVYALCALAFERHLLSFPLLQRSCWRRMKLSLPHACWEGLLAFVLFVLMAKTPNSLLTSSVAALFTLGSALARAALEVSLTLRPEQPPSAVSLGRSLLSPDSVCPARLPSAGAFPTIGRFLMYSKALALLDIAEDRSPTDCSERRDLFSSAEGYVSVIRGCVLRLDLMTTRIRGQLGCPVVQGSAAILYSSLPGTFSSDASWSGGGEKWPNSTVFFDRKLCEWSARTAAALTVASLKEDTFGTAQRHLCNKAALSSLLSALLACQELAVLPQPKALQEFILRWMEGAESLSAFPWPWLRPLSPRLVEPRPYFQKIRTVYEAQAQGTVHSFAVEMADVLRVCLYNIGTAFGEEVRQLHGRSGQEFHGLFGTEGDHKAALAELMAMSVHVTL